MTVSPASLPEIRAELAALLAKASRGPWSVESRGWADGSQTIRCGRGDYDGFAHHSEADAALIVAARNALPGLLVALADAEAARAGALADAERLREALERVNHYYDFEPYAQGLVDAALSARVSPAGVILTPEQAEQVAWVRQEDAEGCGIAVLAMLCGHSYAQVRATVEGWTDAPHDWAAHGVTHYTLDRYLAAHGWFLQRRYDAWTELPLEPFAEIHYASVQQPSNRGHFVVVLADGTVLDPMREGRFRLSEWPHVNQLVGLTRDAGGAAPTRPLPKGTP